MVMGDNSCLKGCLFESQRRILDGHFFTLIRCKNCIVCLKRPKIIEKESGVGPFLKVYDYFANLRKCGNDNFFIIRKFLVCRN